MRAALIGRGRRPRPGRWLLAAGCVVIAVWMVAPTLVAIPMSLTDKQSFTFPPSGWSTRWYGQFFTDPQWYESLLTSLKIAVLVAVVSTVLGTAAAFGLDRSRFAGKGLVNGLLLAPMIVPLVIVAVGVFAVYLRWQLAGTLTGFVLAHTTLAVPFVVVTVASSLRTFDRQLEGAAASLGAGPWPTFRHVTFPLILPGVLSGALFAFITSFDEVVVALFIQSPTLRTLPVQMFSSVTRNIDPTMAAASSMIMVVTTLLVLAAVFLGGRRSHDG